VLYERMLHALLQAILEANLASGGAARVADPGRPLGCEFAIRMEAAGWRVGMEELAGGEGLLYLYRFQRD
jgi:hypothetical protein